jgi:hypothetical protein
MDAGNQHDLVAGASLGIGMLHRLTHCRSRTSVAAIVMEGGQRRRGPAEEV